MDNNNVIQSILRWINNLLKRKDVQENIKQEIITQFEKLERKESVPEVLKMITRSIRDDFAISWEEAYDIVQFVVIEYILVSDGSEPVEVEPQQDIELQLEEENLN